MLQFLNKAALFGLTGVAVPILIHFFARKKVEKRFFSTLRFLKIVQRHTMQRLRIKQILLLILRCLAIFFLVVSFARPVLVSSGVIGRAGSSVVIVLDNSMSMRRDGLWQKAKIWAMSILNLVDEKDDVVLLQSVTLRDDGFAEGKSSIEKVLSSDSVTCMRGDLLKTLNSAVSVLDNSDDLNREIYLISDMQRSGFQDGSVIQHYNGSLFLCPVEGEIDNVGIVDGGVENKIYQQGGVLRVYCTVENFGSSDLDDLLIRVFINGVNSAQKLIDIKARQKRRTYFDVRPRSAGWITGFIEIENDILKDDDRWYFTFYEPDTVDVLLIGGGKDDLRLIRLALNPGGKFSTLFNIEERVFGSIWSDKLSDSDVVIFSNYPYFNDEEVSSVRRFIDSGGGALVLLGSRVDLKNLNGSLLGDLGGIIVGEVIDTPEESGLVRRIDHVDFGHPIFFGMLAKGKENIHSPSFFRTVSLVGDEFYPIIYLSDGMVLLAEVKSGMGGLLLITSGVEMSWSNFGYSTLFAPLIYRAACYLSVGSYESSAKGVVGRPLETSIKLKNINGSFYVITPEKEKILLLPQLRSERVRISFKQITEPGIYSFYRDGQILNMSEVNVDKRESDLREISPSDIERMVPKAEVRVVDKLDGLGEVVSETRFGQELWPITLSFALVLLMIEIVVAQGGMRIFSRKKSSKNRASD